MTAFSTLSRIRAWAIVMLVAAPLATPGLAGAETKHSGTIVAVESDGKTFTLEESGVAGRTARHRVFIEPDSRVVEIARRPDTAESVGPGAWPGDFRETPAATRDLRVGDFVTVTVAADAPTAVARTIEIVRPGGEAVASPR